MEKNTFTKEMRKATRDVHDVSDALVNAKLAFALSSDAVWAEGLLIFYEIFRYLEEAMDRLGHTLVGDLDISGMRRTEAFKKDLTYYLGLGWEKDYIPREKVVEYIQHLKNLENSDPHLLMAYIYHLYMGLLSGGQILQKKRQLFAKYLPFFGTNKDLGYEVTKFGNRTISQIKRELVKNMNDIAEKIGESTKQNLIEESRNVFIKNNEIIKTVQGATKVFVQKLIIILVIIMLIWLIIKMVFSWPNILSS